tara:strand:+ start:221 stop:772 length:552 start_codon:yes stop_codon:yes gene_type:complete
MPRKAPKEVIEHRITLGDFERKQLVEAVESYRKDKMLENIPNIMLGTAGLVVAGTVGFVGYSLYYWLDSVPSITETVSNIFTRPQDAVKSATSKLTKSGYAKFDTLDEVNAQWDDIEATANAIFDKAQQYVTASENGKNYPLGFIVAQKYILRKRNEKMASLAIERSEYIARWTEWKANQSNQ